MVDPYGNAPLTALVELDSHVISDVKVTVHGKGEKGIPVTYAVGKESLATYDGIPIFGLYQKFANKVTVEYKENGKAMKDDYVVQTSAIVNHYMDNRSISDLQQTKVIKVAPGFEDRLYLVNTHTFTPQGAEFHWHGEKDKNAGILDAGPAGGALPFDIAPFTFVVDTEGEYRWWLDQDTFYDGHDMDINKRGYLMGIRETLRGTFTAVQGQHWYEFDMMGQILADHKLPRGFLDASHESIETINDTVLLRVGKRDYRKEDGIHVQTIRDQIIEVDKSGRVVDVWDLTKILIRCVMRFWVHWTQARYASTLTSLMPVNRRNWSQILLTVTPSEWVLVVTGRTLTPLPMMPKMTPLLSLPAIRVLSKSVAINR